MYTKDYNLILERMKTTTELAHDFDNYMRCDAVLQHYERTKAWNCLQDVIREYRLQIEFCGLLEGIRLYSNVQPEQLNDEEIRAQIRYIGQRIPAYILVRECQKELAKEICEWLDKKFDTQHPKCK